MAAKKEAERRSESPADDVDSDDSDERHLCTFAVTGPHPRFQPVFVCRTCQPSSDGEGCDRGGEAATTGPGPGPALLCVCQGCAEACHPDGECHEVDYVGLGPCYCDCPSSSSRCCSLAEDSVREARRLGMDGPLPPPHSSPPPADNDSVAAAGEGSSFPFRHGVYTLPPLVDEEACYALRVQAEELVRHTADTHWVPCPPAPSGIPTPASAAEEELCDLEKLARIVYLRHVEAFGLVDATGDGGAEWWVQVKKVTDGSVPRTDEEMNDPTGTGSAASATAEAGGGKDEAIDLHYDKDEDLAASFGIGSFPAISTVTYLTPGEGGGLGTGGEGEGEGGAVPPAAPPAPTVILPHTYDADESAEMSCALLSHPARGKHLAFDGRLLHGAPAHPSLRRRRNWEQGGTTSSGGAVRGDGAEGSRSRGDVQLSSTSTTSDGTAAAAVAVESKCASARVTFLVNVWPSGRPSGVRVLCDRVRRRIADAEGGHPLNDALKFLRDKDGGGGVSLEFCDRPASTVDVGREEGQRTGHGDLDEGAAERQRVLLPFVSSGATWIDDDLDGGLVLSMVPPPSAAMKGEDTFLVRYEAGWGPRLERLEGGESDEEDEDEATADADTQH